MRRTDDICFRSPSGRTYVSPADREFFEIVCARPTELVGQWIVVLPGGSNQLIAGVHNGKLLEAIGDAHVFQSALDEAGEEFLVLIHARGFLLVKLSLNTPKLSLEEHYRFVARYTELFGYPAPGAHSVAGTEGDAGRLPNGVEIVHRVINRVASALRAAGGVRSDLARHDHETGGVTGIDSLATLAAWRQSPDWYRPTTTPMSGSVRVGKGLFVVPLKTQPRVSRTYNAFIGAAVTYAGEVASVMPRTPGGLLAASLILTCGRMIAGLEPGAYFSPADARKYLFSATLPARSLAFVNEMRALEKMIGSPQFHRPDSAGRVPYMLPPAELVFQQVGVIEVLLSLGITQAQLADAVKQLPTEQGYLFDGYTAWGNTSAHGLSGWRDASAFPSRYRPDLVVLRRRDQNKLLVDAKLREGQSPAGLLSTSGVKDLQAYMQEYKLNRAVMIVPDAQRAGSVYEDVSGEGFAIRAVALPASDWATNRAKLRNYIDAMWNG